MQTNKLNELQQKRAELEIELKAKLQKSILQEAIQGRLVPQNEADAPASELLKRIKTEKERLIKTKKIKANKTESVIYKGDDNSYYELIGKEVRCINEEIPFEIPDSWKWVRISNLFINNPKNDMEDDVNAAFVPMEKIQARYGSRFTYDTVEWGKIKKSFTHFANITVR